jgi:hypothetical protein
MFIGACGGGSKATTCVTGASVPCTCTDGRSGAQTCKSNGTLDVCMCSGSGVDGGGLGGSSGTGGGTADGGAGAGGSGDAGSPMAGAGSTMIVPGNIFLIGCSNQTPASGDRWCAMAMQSVFQGQADLWVVNVSKAAAGTAISCSGSDPNCLRLSTNLFLDQSNACAQNGQCSGTTSFDGDTLIYYADPGSTFVAPSTTSDGTGFIGPVYAWRPGWVGGRALVGDTGLQCFGHPKTDSAACVSNFDSTTSTTQTTVDLSAGKVPATDGAAPLPKVETVIYQASTDPSGVTKFQWDLSPAGDYLLYSSHLATGADPETLRAKKLGDASAPVVVASDVAQWSVNADSTRYYWLKTFNYSTTGADSGILQVAPFPGGAAPTMLDPNAGLFRATGTSVILLDGLAQGLGTLKTIPSSDTPSGIKTLDTAVLGWLDVSQDGGTVLYVKNFDSTNQIVDLYVRNTAAAATCTLTKSVLAAPVGGLSASGSGVAWALYNAQTGIPDGYFTNVSNCTPVKFGSSVVFDWRAMGDQGYTWEDDSATGQTGTLRYAKVANGVLPAGTMIQTQADAFYVSLYPALPAVVYVVATGSAQDGLYINSSLPFTAN